MTINIVMMRMTLNAEFGLMDCIVYTNHEVNLRAAEQMAAAGWPAVPLGNNSLATADLDDPNRALWLIRNDGNVEALKKDAEKIADLVGDLASRSMLAMPRQGARVH